MISYLYYYSIGPINLLRLSEEQGKCICEKIPMKPDDLLLLKIYVLPSDGNFEVLSVVFARML